MNVCCLNGILASSFCILSVQKRDGLWFVMVFNFDCQGSGIESSQLVEWKLQVMRDLIIISMIISLRSISFNFWDISKILIFNLLWRSGSIVNLRLTSNIIDILIVCFTMWDICLIHYEDTGPRYILDCPTTSEISLSFSSSRDICSTFFRYLLHYLRYMYLWDVCFTYCVDLGPL